MVRACINFMTLCGVASKMSLSSPMSCQTFVAGHGFECGFLLGACLHLNVLVVQPHKAFTWRHTFEEFL